MVNLEMTNKKKCTGCHACFNICPQRCISMDMDKDGFWYPKVNQNNCIKCSLCLDVCPIVNKPVVSNKPIAYACINKDDAIRLESSSGGLFTLVAGQIVENDGVVFGAGFDERFNVIHHYVESKEGLRKFRGSKYVQSKIGGTFKQAKDFLVKGRRVLFTGTPCQIGGLKSYLGKDYENLFCMDNICYGVPSPKVWKSYVSFREDEACSRTKGVAFRCKNEGWKQYSVLFTFENNTEYRETHKKDLFMKAFLKNVCLRLSCYVCKFKSLHRQSDITLADFWGIQRVLPEMDDDKGTSLIFVNSSKGQVMYEKIRNQILSVEVGIDNAVSFNPAAIKSAEYNPNRESFFKELDQLEFDKLVNKYCTDTMSVRMKRKTKTVIYKTLKKIGLLNVVLITSLI